MKAIGAGAECEDKCPEAEEGTGPGGRGRQRRQYRERGKAARAEKKAKEGKRGREATGEEERAEKRGDVVGVGVESGARRRRSRNSPGPGRRRVSVGRPGLDPGGREKGRGRLSGPRRETEDSERERKEARERPPLLEPRGPLQRPERGRRAGSPGAASPGWPPFPGAQHSPAAPRSAPTPRPELLVRARRLLGREVNTGAPAAHGASPPGGGNLRARPPRHRAEIAL